MWVIENRHFPLLWPLAYILPYKRFSDTKRRAALCDSYNTWRNGSLRQENESDTFCERSVIRKISADPD